MEQFVNLLLENPLYLVIAVIVSIAVLLLFLKKIIKLLIVVAAVFILYIAYLYWTGGNITEAVRSIEESVDRSFRQGMDFFKKPEETPE